MGLLGWWKGRNGKPESARLNAWRKEWAAAVAAEDGARIAASARSLDELGLTPDDLEIELEMIAGLSELSALSPRLRQGDLPVDRDRPPCGGVRHLPLQRAGVYSRMIPPQPSGRMILTDNRGDLRRRRPSNEHRLAQDRGRSCRPIAMCSSSSTIEKQPTDFGSTASPRRSAGPRCRVI